MCYAVCWAGDGFEGWLVRLLGIVLLLIDNQYGVLVIAEIGVMGRNWLGLLGVLGLDSGEEGGVVGCCER